MSIKTMSVRIDEEMLHKLHIIADHEERSTNSQVVVLIKKLIEQYEKDHNDIFSTKQK